MKVNAARLATATLFMVVLAVAPAAMAVPDGCTLKLPAGIQDAIDHLLLGACDRHDACWQTRNPCGGPYLGASWKASCDAQFLLDLTGVCAAATTILSFPNLDFSSETEFLEACEAGAAAAYAGVSVALTTWYGTQCDNGCNLDACRALGLSSLPLYCCPVLSCQCFFDEQCDLLLPSPEWGTWECIGCQCLLTNSPLVLHLPDYDSSTGSEGQDWWREGFCGPEGPTICLDWRGNGTVACTAWTSPESEIAFVVTLSDDDVVRLADGLLVRAEPWRHFFGNVTEGPDGDFPFGNGFEALAAHCNQSGDASEIDFAQCASPLYAWTDRSADGSLAADELIDLADLGIGALGDLRKTGKRDRCGNTFPAESHAFCSGRPGPCGTWLDVFFESRYPEAQGTDLTSRSADACTPSRRTVQGSTTGR